MGFVFPESPGPFEYLHDHRDNHFFQIMLHQSHLEK